MLGASGPAHAVAPGDRAASKEKLFVGPKLQKQLVTLNKELDRVADYGWATSLARPLFWLLQTAHTLVQELGPGDHPGHLPAEAAVLSAGAVLRPVDGAHAHAHAAHEGAAGNLQGRSRETRPRDDGAVQDARRSNPLSGCLPMLIQMPVFLAFYWVLLESVEMRQAPFFGWINDLSARDPFFILPALNGLAMWVQYKLNPPPPDPMQAKVFQFMPIVFSVMFALFPAGLVLYWVTNTGLSILQQWNINRHHRARGQGAQDVARYRTASRAARIYVRNRRRLRARQDAAHHESPRHHSGSGNSARTRRRRRCARLGTEDAGDRRHTGRRVARAAPRDADALPRRGRQCPSTSASRCFSPGRIPTPANTCSSCRDMAGPVIVESLVARVHRTRRAPRAPWRIHRARVSQRQDRSRAGRGRGRSHRRRLARSGARRHALAAGRVLRAWCRGSPMR